MAELAQPWSFLLSQRFLTKKDVLSQYDKTCDFRKSGLGTSLSEYETFFLGIDITKAKHLLSDLLMRQNQSAAMMMADVAQQWLSFLFEGCLTNKKR